MACARVGDPDQLLCRCDSQWRKSFRARSQRILVLAGFSDGAGAQFFRLPVRALVKFAIHQPKMDIQFPGPSGISR